MKKKILSLALVIAMMLSVIPFGVIAEEDSSLPFVQNFHLGDIDNGESPRTIYWDPVEGASLYAIYVKSPSGTICHGTTVFDNEGIQSHFFYYMDYTWDTFPSGTYEFEIWAVDSNHNMLTQRTYLTHNFSNVIKAPDVEINVPIMVNEPFEIDLVNDASELHESVYNNDYHIVVKNEEDIPSWMSIDEKGVLRGTAPNTCNFGESFTIYFETGADARAFSVNYSLVADGKEYVIQDLEFTRPSGCEYAYYRKTGYGDSVYGVWPVLDTVNYTIGNGIGSYSPKSNRESDIIKSVDWDFRKWNPETEEYELFDSDEMFNVGHYAMFMLIESKKSDADDKKAVFSDDLNITVGTKTVPAEDIGVLGYDGGEKLGVFPYKYYLYDYKPEINEVSINNDKIVSDGDVVYLKNNRISLVANWDSELTQALTKYGCTVNNECKVILNGRVVTSGWYNSTASDGTTSTVYSNNNLNIGDTLKVVQNLTVTWPDGKKDIVAQHTTNAVCLDMDFSSLNPTPTDTELINGYTDLGTMKLGSADTNINFYGFPIDLPDNIIEDGWFTYRCITVTRDGVEIYDRTYADNEVFGWNLKENIDEGGTYVITLGVYAEKGDTVSGKTHKYRVYVNGSVIKTVNTTITPPLVGKTQFETGTAVGSDYYVSNSYWSYYNEEYDAWYGMPDDMLFEAGKTYRCELTIKPNDGILFANSADQMTAYINGQKANIIENPYYNYKLYAECDFEAVESVEIGGIVMTDGDFLWNGATETTDTAPTNTTVGYAYYSDGYLIMNNYSNDQETLQFFGENLTIDVRGNCLIGSIYDGSFPVGTSLGIIPGNLTINTYSDSSIAIAGYAFDAYTALRVYGDVTITGGGEVTIVTNDVYSAAVDSPSTFTVDGGSFVIIYGTNHYGIWGSDSCTTVDVKDGQLALVGATSGAKNVVFENDNILVGTGLLTEVESCTSWDGTTDISNYKTVWVINEKPDYILGDINGDETITATDYILAKRAVMGTYTMNETQIDAGDINGDGSITATDYILAKRAVMGTYIIG